MDHGKYDHVTYDHLHEQRIKRGYSRQAPKVASETRLAPIDAEESNRTPTEDNAMDTSASVTSNRGRAPAGVAEYADGALQNQEKRRRAGSLRLFFFRG